jgi:hypothetical protein
MAIWVYSSTDENWYEVINGVLWGARSGDVSAFAAILNSALSKLLTYEGTVYRGYTPPDLDEFVRSYDPGMYIRWPGFTSTTGNREKAFSGNVLFRIKVKSGRILGDYADKSEEEEVLLPSGARVYVLALERDGDAVIVDLEERP